MKVEHYSFGKITIDGTTYTSDVIIYPDKVDSAWWRKEGHSLHIEDLQDIIQAQPEILVVGTGNYGVMDVPSKTLSYLQSKGIEVYAEPTEKAVSLFNKLQKKKKTIGALHLTC